ncbi:ladderlectin-like [Gambusia affinis]|uniref:ladderlectin-like n=1 Tax=Gambusia affinis TaxID=33528 RepID=UPI001CDD8AAB|nr:ladderlectin-like [Gambusia affinis]
MAAGLVFTLLLGLSFGLWDGADAYQMEVADCNECSPGWAWCDGRCFLYVKKKMTWAKAERFCLSLDGHLASLTSTNDYNFIREYIYNTTKQHTETWVGGHDSVEHDYWMWSDGSRFVFHNWGLSEPNNFGGNEKCMNINVEGNDHVNDDTCSKKFSFVCAKPL